MVSYEKVYLKTKFPRVFRIHRKYYVSHLLGLIEVPQDEVGIAMTKGVLDILTVIDPELVPDKGIKWVKREIRMRCASTGISYSHPKWKAFGGYFRAMLLELYNIEEWNVYDVQNELVARTNNPLERFYRELNRAFSPHPSIVTFVSTIRQISQDNVAKLTDIVTGRRNRGTTTNAKDEFEVPSPVDLQQSKGLSESESEDDAPSLEELESENSTDIEAAAAENAAEEGEFIPDFSFEYEVENEPSETGIEDDH
ncbi:hypothetical protein PHPALM_28012 [Phytophthora palmivora]|uniref:Uncharacterized protein n=1 Tax=Phytophthora palmivora TaxID=4796 RepID=A0A2P4XB89_9STRA|nr:hypothetical protein PHPALM_28012 [Phytophthora palmivora]